MPSNVMSSKKQGIRVQQPNGRVTAYQQQTQLRVGPLPPAEELDHYNQVLPGSAERIVQMAEKQQVHMHKRETRDQIIVVFGQLTGLLMGLAGIGLAYYMVWSETAGTSQVMWAIAGVISVALTGRLLINARKSKE